MENLTELQKNPTTPELEIDWNNLTQSGHIFKYKDKDRLNLNNYQKQTLNMYDGVTMNNTSIESGMVVSGVVKSLSKKEIVVDINYKDDVFVENKLSDAFIISGLKIGDQVDVLIKKVQQKPFVIKGSIMDLLKIKVNDKIVDSFNNGTPLTALVTELIPAGYMLNLELDNITMPAFMPNTLADVNKLYDPTIIIGKRIQVMVETLQQEKGVYVVSRRKYLKTLIPAKMKSLKYNTVYEGSVTGTTPFGVFVQFEECLTGMIHKMNINPDYVDKIQQIAPGTLIDFYIKEITNTNKIILTQHLEESVWDTIEIGSIFSGEVVAIKPFGALVKLDQNTNGLIPNMQLGKLNRQLKEGEVIDVRVINILKDERKIFLVPNNMD